MCYSRYSNGEFAHSSRILVSIKKWGFMATRSTQVARLNLTLRGPGIKRTALFKALSDLSLRDTRWQRNNALEVGSRAGELDDETVSFSRQSGDGLAAANLVMELRPYGCQITDIVSVEAEPLSCVEYNALAEDFLARIGTPAAVMTGFKVEVLTTPARSHVPTSEKNL